MQCVTAVVFMLKICCLFQLLVDKVSLIFCMRSVIQSRGYIMGLECYGLLSIVYVKVCVSDCNVACVRNSKTCSENVDLLLVSSHPPSQTQENKYFEYL